MKKSKVDKRTKVKPFLKLVNFNHIMPTRYSVDFDLKKQIDEFSSMTPEVKTDSKKTIKKLFEEKYKSQQSAKSDKKAAGASYFFQKLRF